MLTFSPRFWLRAAFVGVISQLVPATSEATTMEAMSLAQLTQEASLIAVGTVRGRTSQVDEFGRIVTDHRIEVHEVWKGSAQVREVLMRSLGGDVGDLAMTVAGAPHLSVGQQALFFLRPSSLKNPSPAWMKPLGMSQGVFRIQPGSIPGVNGGSVTPTVLPGAEGLRLLQLGVDGHPTNAMSAISTPTALTKVRNAVLQRLEQQRRREDSQVTP